MHYKQDWVMRQVEAVIKFVCSVLGISNPENIFETETGAESESLISEIETLLENKKLLEAESIIFEKIDNGSEFDIRIALWFYEKTNAMSDADLEKSGFSRERVLKGIVKSCQKSGIVDSNTIEFLIN